MASQLLPAPSLRSTPPPNHSQHHHQRQASTTGSKRRALERIDELPSPPPSTITSERDKDRPRVKRLRASYETVEPAFASLSLAPTITTTPVPAVPCSDDDTGSTRRAPHAAPTLHPPHRLAIPSAAHPTNRHHLSSPTTTAHPASLPVTPPTQLINNNPTLPPTLTNDDTLRHTPDSFFDDVPMTKPPSSFDIDKHTIYVASLSDDDDDEDDDNDDTVDTSIKADNSDDTMQLEVPSYLAEATKKPPSPLPPSLVTASEARVRSGQLVLYTPPISKLLFDRDDDDDEAVDERRRELDEYVRSAQREEAVAAGMSTSDDDDDDEQMQLD